MAGGKLRDAVRNEVVRGYTEVDRIHAAREAGVLTPEEAQLLIEQDEQVMALHRTTEATRVPVPLPFHMQMLHELDGRQASLRRQIEDLDRLLEEEQEGLACEPFLSESQRREERAGQISHAAVLLGQNFYQAAAEVEGLCNRVDLLEQNLRRRMPSEMRMAQRFGEFEAGEWS